MSTPLEHEWETVSRHRTSEGLVAYQRCRCGTRRIRLERGPAGGFVTPDGRRGAAAETVAESFRVRRRPARWR